MKAKDKVVYVPPVYEEVQHEVTSVDDKNNPLRTSFIPMFLCCSVLIICVLMLRLSVKLKGLFSL